MKKLTVERLKEMANHELIACGVTLNHPEHGINMASSNQGEELLWVAVRGTDFPDWAVYAYWKAIPQRDAAAARMMLGEEIATRTGAPKIDWVCEQGEKVREREHVEKLVGKVDDEVWKMYRQ